MTYRKISLLTVLALLLLGMIGVAWWFFPEREPKKYKPGWPADPRALLGKSETCFDCHSGMTGFEAAHNPEVIGCTPCHLGNPRAKGLDESHRGMVSVPGNFADMYRTCATANCHGDIAKRLEKSLMGTMSGVVTIDRHVFDGRQALGGDAHIRETGRRTPADQHLRQLCASCHLGNEKHTLGPVTERSRGGGCNACHLNYTDLAAQQLQAYLRDRQQRTLPRVHPALNLQVTDRHCFGCHSRSGRISTNYEGWHETQLTPAEAQLGIGHRLLADGRVMRAMPADVHHEAGLECIDCHIATEVMGDGRRYQHKEEAVKTQCSDCHFRGKAATLPLDSLDAEAKKIVALRQMNLTDRFVVSPKTGLGLVNVRIGEGGRPYLVGKNSEKVHVLKPPAEACTQGKGHRDLTCGACHSAWAPQCIGCHNAYDRQAEAFDLLDRKPTFGKWIEYLGEYFAEAPTLGVMEHSRLDSQQVRAIREFIPGMIISVDAGSFSGKAKSGPSIEKRLFAPAAPHTTSRKGRSCVSCHNSSLALGYGRGTLSYQVEGRDGCWIFQPEYATLAFDDLPQDAWSGFLAKAEKRNCTRPNGRPFDLSEQRLILTAGACLTCHEGASKVMRQALDDFDATLRRVSPRCVLPVWE
jgi:hypothetical protein